VISDLRAITRDPSFQPSSPKAICNAIFHTAYMGTKNSSAETKTRAKKLADVIGSYHLDIDIDRIVDSFLHCFFLVTSKKPQFKLYGGSSEENLALQNVQARSRMVVAYLFAQLLLWTRGKNSASLLVLGSSNVDETLRGYLTKYDCSSADLNPIGGISKVDLRNFIQYWSIQDTAFSFLKEFLDAPPTAELEPSSDTYVQIDEVIIFKLIFSYFSRWIWA
jgi:NAD+ synthase (glutamine-hydrolysing)